VSNIHNIEDEMALACQCGCVRFNLLKSDAIECDSCQLKQNHLIWREIMDANYKPEPFTKIEPIEEQISEARDVIKAAINKNQSCYWGDVVKENNGRLPILALLGASFEMQREKIIRLRDDSLEHDLEYILR
jgi:hypothetical protein